MFVFFKQGITHGNRWSKSIRLSATKKATRWVALVWHCVRRVPLAHEPPDEGRAIELALVTPQRAGITGTHFGRRQ
jgi:hypothetical protein